MKKFELKQLIKEVVQEVLNEHYGDDDYEDDMRSQYTDYHGVKGSVLYHDAATDKDYEYDYRATIEVYKGEYAGSEIDEITPSYKEDVEFDELSSNIQKKITRLIYDDIQNRI
jgi:hypothetical protein